jgi:cob(I)alamin adenosyltransferase
MRIYTKTGDGGETGLFDGTRVSKSDARVDAYGDVDELNGWLGLVRASPLPAALAPRVNEMLAKIQRDLFAVGAQLADPRHKIAARVDKALLFEADITALEHWIDEMEAPLPPLRRFLLPGGSVPGAMLHVARTVCRRAERRIVSLVEHEKDAVEPAVIVYINRLSDLLFTLARAVNHAGGTPETEW